ncbi:hypothetical protein [uncultured Robinsoniella sp.]|uniref:hypothetical protein n=1 Tax=uncultured Robinsoniella sp. TaxID=904190 RepID=UPI00374F6BF2
MEIVNVAVMEFMGNDVRVVNGEWLVLKDIFLALGRVRKDGTWTHEKNKLVKMLDTFGEENYLSVIKMRVENANRSNSYWYYICLKLEVFDRFIGAIKAAFMKGICTTIDRPELYFANKVKKIFMKDDIFEVKTQVRCLQYRIDIAIGSAIFVEYDEYQHNYTQKEDMNRMKQIATCCNFNTKLKVFDFTNRWEDNEPEIEHYKNYSVYDFLSCSFIRVRDKDCFEWLKEVQDTYQDIEEYCRYVPSFSFSTTDEFYNYKVV